MDVVLFRLQRERERERETMLWQRTVSSTIIKVCIIFIIHVFHVIHVVHVLHGIHCIQRLKCSRSHGYLYIMTG